MEERGGEGRRRPPNSLLYGGAVELSGPGEISMWVSSPIQRGMRFGVSCPTSLPGTGDDGSNGLVSNELHRSSAGGILRRSTPFLRLPPPRQQPPTWWTAVNTAAIPRWKSQPTRACSSFRVHAVLQMQ